MTTTKLPRAIDYGDARIYAPDHTTAVAVETAINAANDEGTIQAWDAARSLRCPTLGTAQNVLTFARALGCTVEE